MHVRQALEGLPSLLDSALALAANTVPNALLASSVVGAPPIATSGGDRHVKPRSDPPQLRGCSPRRTRPTAQNQRHGDRLVLQVPVEDVLFLQPPQALTDLSRAHRPYTLDPL